MTIIYVAGIILIIAGFTYYRHVKKQQQIREELQTQWGHKQRRKYNWARLRTYYDFVWEEEASPAIDDDTWADLDMNEVFALADRTQSVVGQQVLYSFLRRPVFSEAELKKRNDSINEMLEEPELRLALQMKLRKLRHSKLWNLSELLFNPLPDFPAVYKVFFLIPVTVAVFIAAGFLNPAFWLALIVIPVLNMGIQYVMGSRVARFTLPISSLGVFLSVAGDIEEKLKPGEGALSVISEEIGQDLKTLKKLKKRARLFINEGSKDNLMTMVVDYLNVLLLMNVLMLLLLISAIAQHRKVLKRLFKNIGYIDVMISAASFKTGLPQLCTPEFGPKGSTLSYDQLYHPLLEDPVPNSVQIGEKGLLITGSNMSGKSTFLKTAGVNQILAQCFNFCCAARARIGFYEVISSMRREDDITEGKSYYQGEVLRIKKLIEQSQKSKSALFLLDEMFKGTNSLERISASAEVLQWLNRPGNHVLASTHDLELTELLTDSFSFFHFSEKVGAEGLEFDYVIKPGYASTSNAIRLLEVSGYPAEIVQGAMETARKLQKEGFHRLSI